jgi:hypothetical protein
MDLEADDLFRHANALDESMDFTGAFRDFIGAARAYRRNGEQDNFYVALMRAGTAIAKSEGWRTQAALWERLGAELSLELEPNFPYRFESRPGQNDIYHVVSHEDWRMAAGATDRAGWLSHRRALAYKWAADNIADERQFVLAARLFRKAGASWEKIELPVPPIQGVREDEFRQPLHAPNRWREAARCYLRGATNALRTTDWETYDRVHESWHEEELEWGVERSARSPSPDPLAGSDLERVSRCWQKYREEVIPTLEYIDVPKFRAKSLEEEARQLAEIQRLYALRGDRRHARRVEHRRQCLYTRAARARRQWGSYLARQTYTLVTRSGTSGRRTVLWAAFANLLIVPLYYFASHSLVWADTRTAVGWWESITFSSATLLSLSLPQYAVVGLPSLFVQIGQALVGYGILGYLLWLFLRSYLE